MRGKEVLFFMVCLAAAASVMTASGFNDAVGIGAGPDVGADVQGDVEDLSKDELHRSGEEFSFIDGILSGFGTMRRAIEILFALPLVLHSVGVPLWAATFASAPVYLTGAWILIYMVSGRRA